MMLPFDQIKEHCEKNRILSKKVIDDFIIDYSAAKERLDPEMEALIRKYQNAARELQQAHLNFFKSEYIAHLVFKKDGLIHKFLNHSAFQGLPLEQMEYLRFNSENPWRFSIAEVSSNPEDSFFKMEDAMTCEDYLLYSPGLQDTLKKYHTRLWFNLIAFNGQCWQTFGLIIPFTAFTADDIFFFATELNPKIRDEEMLMDEVEKNPFPFFMLVCGATLPVIVSRGHETLLCQSSDSIPGLPTERLKSSFDVAWNKNVYRLSLKKLAEIPHFAQAYYNEDTRELLRTSMTAYGFNMLTKALLKNGINLPEQADVSVTLTMLNTTEKILNRKIQLNPYESYFSLKNEEREDLKNINAFLNLALPFYNAGIDFDINELAKKAGIDPVMAADLWKQVKKSTDELKNNKHK
jgi:hypothetical protein